MNRTLSKFASAAALAIALVFVIGGTAQAQLAKSGKYSGQYGWSSSGTAFEMEEGRTIWVGSYGGAFFNDAGKGFLHNSSTLCVGYSDIVKGYFNSHGYCVVTDKDGDKAFITWTGTGDYPKLSGPFQWNGGTGKYTGMSGGNMFFAEFIPGTDQGHVRWDGEWKLP